MKAAEMNQVYRFFAYVTMFVDCLDVCRSFLVIGLGKIIKTQTKIL